MCELNVVPSLHTIPKIHKCNNITAVHLPAGVGRTVGSTASSGHGGIGVVAAVIVALGSGTVGRSFSESTRYRTGSA